MPLPFLPLISCGEMIECRKEKKEGEMLRKVSQKRKLAKRKKALELELKRITEILIKEYAPEKIILFGSFAAGNIHTGSDLDLLIIKETDKRPIERILEVARLVKPEIGIDLFVYTPEEIEMFLKEGYRFFREIHEKGKIIYEKRD